MAKLFRLLKFEMYYFFIIITWSSYNIIKETWYNKRNLKYLYLILYSQQSFSLQLYWFEHNFYILYF